MQMVTVALLRHGGSHLIRPLVTRLMPTAVLVEPGKGQAALDEAMGPIVVLRRDPRNRMVSTLRWMREKGGLKATELESAGQDDDSRLAWLLTHRTAQRHTFIEGMTKWARIWCSWSDGLQLRFEDFAADGVFQVERLALHLGVECDAASIYSEVYGIARTYTGRHSIWQEWAGPKSIAAWKTGGGPELMEIMGYD